MFIDDLLIIGSIFFPLFCILIMMVKWKARLDEIGTAQLFIIIEILIIFLAAAVMPLEFPKITSFLEIYLAFIVVYALLLFFRSGRMELSFLFPAATLMVFVAADIWEYPVFVYGTLHLFNPDFQLWAGQWFDQIHRFYVLGLFGTLLMLIKWKVTFWSIAFLFCAIFTPFVILMFSPFPGWADVVRIITLILFGTAIYLGVGKNGKSD